MGSVGSFKQKIRHSPKPNPVDYTRHASIEMARLRCRNGSLKLNFFNRSLSKTPTCQCGEIKTDIHYFETYPNYDEARNECKREIQDIPWSTKLLYHGSTHYNKDINLNIQRAGQRFIELSKRFY